MARKDLPCADCGAPMWRTRSSSPEGVATCNPCRRNRETYRPNSPNKGARVTTWSCVGCGKQCEREPARGQIPKWCSQRCADLAKKGRVGTCERCHAEFYGHGIRFCSLDCANLSQRKPKAPKARREPVDQRGPLRRGYEDGDTDIFFRALQAKADTSSGCWIWPRVSDGYPSVKFGRRTLALHRLVLEMKHGAPLGSQQAHHTCATAACVNPEHLQPVTHRENVAEMLARQSYLSRIDELERALAEFNPNHPLLAVIAVA